MTVTKNAPALVEPTAIRLVTTDAPVATALFDLQGRRVEKAVKGIYIVDGKKVIR